MHKVSISQLLLPVIALSLLIKPAESQFEALIRKATEKIIGQPSELTIDIPSCLVELQGGIIGVEKSLVEGIEADQKWAVLVTSSQDSLTAPATIAYYEALNEACSTSSPLASSLSDGSDDSSDDISKISPKGLSDWQFAHLSFDNEPALIWRWWIWKVPTILFISPPTQSQMPYDIRYWKIAFELPKKDRILQVIEEGSWQNLAIWQSSLGPGGTLAIIPSMTGQFFGLFYNVFDPIPNWLLTVLATAGGSLLVSFLHGGR